jgi:phage-related protein
MAWTVETLNETVDKEYRSLPDDMQSRFNRISAMIEKNGISQVHEPYVKHLQGALWEMRMRGRSGISRALYMTVIGQRVVVLRIFIKKTEKTPAREIELALKRAKEIVS